MNSSTHGGIYLHDHGFTPPQKRESIPSLVAAIAKWEAEVKRLTHNPFDAMGFEIAERKLSGARKRLASMERWAA